MCLCMSVHLSEVLEEARRGESDPLKLSGTDVGESNSSPLQEQYVF